MLRPRFLPSPFVPWAVAVLFAAGGASPLHAQYMKSEVTVWAAGGWSFPTGRLGDEAEVGAGLSGGVDYALTPSWAVGARLACFSFDAKETTAADALRRARYLAGDLHAKLYLYPESWFTPHALGGLGVYTEHRWQGSGATMRESDRTRLGLVGGFGLSVHRQASRWTVFSELAYHHQPSSTGSRQFVYWSTGLRVSFGGRPF